MENIGLFAVALVGLGIAIVFALFRLTRANQELAEKVSERLAESERHLSENMHSQLKSSSDIVRDVTEKLTRLDETNKQVVSFADQLKSLQDILKNPKQRGILGEYYLETLLKNVLPVGSYQMQYPFADGTIVDAVVFVRDKIIPIDSKFSLENYNRLVEERDAPERERLEKGGLIFSGMSPDGTLPEIVERPDHPWFVGVQFHPELKS
ncbi:MAG: hypothetical protein UY69_C0021G0013, partial [Parcubacteria group bacterium GW2011_GWF1_52_5]